MALIASFQAAGADLAALTKSVAAGSALVAELTAAGGSALGLAGELEEEVAAAAAGESSAILLHPLFLW